VWGPLTWKKIEYECKNYPVCPSKLNKETFKLFIDELFSKLPCGDCTYHATNYLTENKIFYEDALSSSLNLEKFFSDFHNMVNCRLGKKLFLFNYYY